MGWSRQPLPRLHACVRPGIASAEACVMVRGTAEAKDPDLEGLALENCIDVQVDGERLDAFSVPTAGAYTLSARIGECSQTVNVFVEQAP